MSDTAEDWGMVANLLAANTDRFPDEDFVDVIRICRMEADRLDREAAEDAFAEELARLELQGESKHWVDVGHERNAARCDYDVLTGDEQAAARLGARAILEHLADRLAPAGGMVLTSDEVADLRNVLDHGHPMSADRLRARFAPAEKPAPRSWPSLDKVPHDVNEVTDRHGDRYWRTGDGPLGWTDLGPCGPRTCLTVRSTSGPFTEQVSA